MRHDASFFSDGAKIAAHLYLPENISTPCPGIVLCHGFAGIKELLLPSFAEHFCKNGYAALCFDYRGFGESEGEAGRLVPENQIRDIRNALTWFQSRDEIDASRLALWGTSFGGANAIIAAARDKRIRCLCVQLTFGSGLRVITGALTEDEKKKLSDTLRKMQQKKVCANREMMVSVHKVLSDEQSKKFYDETVERFPALNVKIPFLTVAETMDHNPEKYLRDLHIPIHITAADNDRVNPPDESKLIFNVANEPKDLFIVENATHYELYKGDLCLRVANRQTEWFKRYL